MGRAVSRQLSLSPSVRESPAPTTNLPIETRKSKYSPSQAALCENRGEWGVILKKVFISLLKQDKIRDRVDRVGPIFFPLFLH